MTQSEIEKQIKEMLVTEFDCDDGPEIDKKATLYELGLDVMEIDDFLNRLEARFKVILGPRTRTNIRSVEDAVLAVTERTGK